MQNANDASIFSKIITIVLKFFALMGELFYIPFDKILPLPKFAAFIYKRYPRFWKWLVNKGIVRRLLSRSIVRKFGAAAPHRPHPFTAAQDHYSTWYGFVDRTYSGRHLQPFINDEVNETLSAQELSQVFLTSGDYNQTKTQESCERSSLLFAAFAQWFTDSFLRTAHSFDLDGNKNVQLLTPDGPIIRLPGRHRRNTSNHEIDLCQIYGLSEEKTKMLRSETEKGCLKYETHDDGEYPPFLLDLNLPKNGDELLIKPEFVGLHDEPTLRPIFRSAENTVNGYETLFAVGLEHGNSTLSNSLMNTIFLREHNRVARKVSDAHSSWDDERVFQTTRNIMIVQLLNIVISDYIRHIAPFDIPLEVIPGYADKFEWYRTNRISLEFNLLYRWHSLVPNKFEFLDEKATDPAYNPGQFRSNNDWLIKTNLADVIESFTRQKAGKITLGNAPAWMLPVERDSISLMRDAKFKSYNAYRQQFSLKPHKSFDQLTDDPGQQEQLSKMCGGDIDKLEWYIGLFAEKHDDFRIMGELMLTMVAHDAFTQALTNPLLARHVYNEETFSDVGWDIVQKTKTLKQIVNRVVPDSGNRLCSFRHPDAIG